MSIHELYFDDQGKIIKTRCLDAEILAALDANAGNSETTEGGASFPGIEEETPVPLHNLPQNLSHMPIVIRTLTAISLTQIREEEAIWGHVLGWESGWGKTEGSTIVHDYENPEIKPEILRIGDMGLVFSQSTDIYVASNNHKQSS